MTRALLAAATTALALLAPNAATAAAGPAYPVAGCDFTTMTQPFARDRQLAVLGGAVVAVGDGDDLRTGRVTCALRKGDTHADPVLASVTSLTTPGVAAVPASVVEYVLGPADPFTICLSAEVDGAGTYYWDGVAETWSASPLVTCYDWTPRDPTFELLIDVAEAADAAVCAALAGAPSAGPVRIEADGDVYVAEEWVWDCPPYEGTS